VKSQEPKKQRTPVNRPSLTSTKPRRNYKTEAVLITKGGIILAHSNLSGGVICPPIRKNTYIQRLSKRSLSRLALTAQVLSPLLRSMLTLTYGVNYPLNGKLAKEHLQKMLTYLKKLGCKAYLWFMEFQTRGAVHFHIMLDLGQFHINLYREELARLWAHITEPYGGFEYSRIKPDRFKRKLVRVDLDPKNSKAAVFEVARHPRTWELLRSKDGAAKYVTKYALKSEQKDVPPGFKFAGRFWGTTQEYSMSNLVETWVHVDENGLEEMLRLMNRDFSSFEYLPKIIVGDTSKILEILSKEENNQNVSN